MRVHNDYKEGWNVAAQVDDPNSVFSFWQKLLKLRKEYEALVYGNPFYHQGVISADIFRNLHSPRREERKDILVHST